MTEVEQAPARRLRAQDVIDSQAAMIEKLLTRGGGGERSSVTLSRNAKGDTQIEVVVRGDDHTLTTAELVAAKATELFDAASAKYPYSGGAAKGANGE